MGAVVLDASVVLALLDSSDTTHVASVGAVREARARSDSLLLPASALSEVLVGSMRQGPSLVDNTLRFVDRIVDSVAPADRDVALHAARLRAGHRSLRLPDALVVGTALVHEAQLLTCDRALGRVDDCVTVVA